MENKTQEFELLLDDIEAEQTEARVQPGQAAAVLFGALAAARTPLADKELADALGSKLYNEKPKNPVKLVRQVFGRAAPFVVRENGQYRFADDACKQAAFGRYADDPDWYEDRLIRLYADAWAGGCESGDTAVDAHARTEYAYLLAKTNQWSRLWDHVYSRRFTRVADLQPFGVRMAGGLLAFCEADVPAMVAALTPPLRRAIGLELADALARQVRGMMDELKNDRPWVSAPRRMDDAAYAQYTGRFLMLLAAVGALAQLLLAAGAADRYGAYADAAGGAFSLVGMVETFAESEAGLPRKFSDHASVVKDRLEQLRLATPQNGAAVKYSARDAEYIPRSEAEWAVEERFRARLRGREVAGAIAFLEDVYADEESVEAQTRQCLLLARTYFYETGMGDKARWFAGRALRLCEELSRSGRAALKAEELQEAIHIAAQLSASEGEYDDLAAAMYEAAHRAPLIMEQLPRVLNLRKGGAPHDRVRSQILSRYCEAVYTPAPREDYGYGPAYPPGWPRISCSVEACVLGCLLDDMVKQGCTVASFLNETTRYYAQNGVLALCGKIEEESAQPDRPTLRGVCGHAIRLLEQVDKMGPGRTAARACITQIEEKRSQYD